MAKGKKGSPMPTPSKKAPAGLKRPAVGTPKMTGKKMGGKSKKGCC